MTKPIDTLGTTSSSLQHKGTWVVPKNLGVELPTQISSIILDTQKNLNALCETLESTIKVGEKIKRRDMWKRTHIKKLWFPFINYRVVDKDTTKTFSKWWNDEVKDRYQKSEMSKQASDFLSKVSKGDSYKIYNKFFHGGTSTILEDDNYLSWEIWRTQANRNIYNRNDCCFHLGGGIYLLGYVSSLDKLNTLIEYLQNRKYPNYDDSSKYLKTLVDEFDDVDDEDDLDIESQNKAIAESNRLIIKRYLEQKAYADIVKKIEKSLAKHMSNTQDELFEIPTFETAINYENYIHIDEMLVAIVKNSSKMNRITDGLVSRVDMIEAEEYQASNNDEQKSVPLQTIFGDLSVFKNILKDNALLRRQRSELLGNGVVPQTCAIVTRELLDCILTKKYMVDYLPSDVASIEELEKALDSSSKKGRGKKINLDRMSRYDSSDNLFQVEIDPNVKNESIEYQIVYEDDLRKFPSGFRWATPTVGDSNNANQEKAIINYMKTSTKKVGDVEIEQIVKIDRQKSSLISNIFVEYFKHHKVKPSGDLKIYPKTGTYANQNWIDSLMGLTSGWTNPMFGWQFNKDTKSIPNEIPKQVPIITTYKNKKKESK